MKKLKAEDAGSNSMDRILELPNEILQRISDLPQGILQKILYFLSQKEAVRTSVLSKSWRYIWCTRPNLDFSDTSFDGKKQEFLSTVDKTLQLYCDQRLSLEEFRLSISLLGTDYSDQEFVSLLDQWIPRFETIGVKEFRLSIHSKTWPVDLSSVVFKAEFLKILCLKRCKLWQNTPENIPFDRLQVLRLHNVLIKKTISDTMISSCPLLTTIFFNKCKGLKTIKLEKKLHNYLKHFTFINDDTHIRDECSIEIDDIPTLETIKIVGSKIRFHGHKFTNLHSLSLKSVNSSSESIQQSQLLSIDAPKIKYFGYKGNFIPSISFTPTPKDWRRSNIELYISGAEEGKSWFVKLSKLLQDLSPSEISLDIVQYYRNIMHIQEDILVQNVINGGNYKPVVVEHLRLNFVNVSSLPSFLDCLFCICRPRNITQRWSKRGDLKKQWEQKELIEYCCKIREIGNYQETAMQENLVDLRIEGFDTRRKQWQPLQRSSLLERESLNISSIRIQLKWSGFRIIDDT